MDKSIKVSTRAYEVMVKRKNETGVPIRRQVDDLVFGKNDNIRRDRPTKTEA